MKKFLLTFVVLTLISQLAFAWINPPQIPHFNRPNIPGFNQPNNSAASPEMQTARCTFDSDCARGYVCAKTGTNMEGFCLRENDRSTEEPEVQSQSCRFDMDCADGYSCASSHLGRKGVCVKN